MPGPVGVRRAATAATGDPFTLGVASGDPLTDRVVLWTRLALDPLSTGAPGGMPTTTYDVVWGFRRDAQFSTVVSSGTAQTTAARDDDLRFAGRSDPHGAASRGRAGLGEDCHRVMCAASVCDTLDEYRLRYTQTKADTEL